MMISTNLDSVDIPQQDYETYLQSCASQFKKLHKFKTNSTVEIRVYQGGKGFGNQLLPFRQACEIIYSKSSFRTVFLTCADVNTFKLTELDIINWLLEGDIHFIISHIHQGIVNINMNKLYTEIMRLHDHPGFPNGSNLLCPVSAKRCEVSAKKFFFAKNDQTGNAVFYWTVLQRKSFRNNC